LPLDKDWTALPLPSGFSRRDPDSHIGVPDLRSPTTTTSPIRPTIAPATNAPPSLTRGWRTRQDSPLATSERRPPRRRTPSRVQPTTTLLTLYVFPLPRRPRSPYAALSARCMSSKVVKPSMLVTRKMRPETMSHTGTLSSYARKWIKTPGRAAQYGSTALNHSCSTLPCRAHASHRQRIGAQEGQAVSVDGISSGAFVEPPHAHRTVVRVPSSHPGRPLPPEFLIAATSAAISSAAIDSS
jgi:hypothetical protein